MAERIEFCVGSPVEPRELWFRDDIVSNLWRTLESHHALLIGPRRTGKTSVMHYLRDNPKDGALVVYLNAQDLGHPSELFEAVVSALHVSNPSLTTRVWKGWRTLEGLAAKAAATIGTVSAGGIEVALRDDARWRTDWRQHGSGLLRAIRVLSNKVILVIDEFPDFVLNLSGNSDQLVKEFLAWFRTERQSPAPRNDQIRWLLGGSINLPTTLEDLSELDSINDIVRETLPTLTPLQVAEFFERMLTDRGLKLREGATAHFTSRLGRPIPLFMQVVTQEVYRICERERQQVTVEVVDLAFKSLLTSPASRDKFKHFYARIGMHYQEPKRSAAYRLLSCISGCTSDGVSLGVLRAEFNHSLKDANIEKSPFETNQIVGGLLQDLDNDFYVSEVADGRYDFSCGVLKEWWNKHYG